MSENPRQKITSKPIQVAEIATSEINQENLEERRKKLSSDIGELRLVISRAECQLSLIKFRDVATAKEIFFDKPSNSRRDFGKIHDVELLTKSELHSLAGISCKKIGNGFVFNFQSWDAKFGSKNSYWIQLFNDAENWQLGLWVLPMSLDVREIMKNYPIDSPMAMKYFLRECKHRIDCYNRRKQQYVELEIFMTRLNLYNCYVEADPGFTRITIKLVKQLSPLSNETRIILVDLWYKSNETRSSKMIIDCDDSRELSPDETKKFRLYFKSFKELDLKDAAEKILMSDESQSLWRRASQDDVILIDNDDDDVDSSFAITTKRRSSRRKKRQNNSETSDKSGKNVSSSVATKEPSSSAVSVSLPKKNSRRRPAVKPRKPKSPREKKISRPIGRPKKRKAEDENFVDDNKRAKKMPINTETNLPTPPPPPIGKRKNLPLRDRNENIENFVKIVNVEKNSAKNSKKVNTSLKKSFSPLNSAESERISGEKIKEERRSIVKGIKKFLTASTPLIARSKKLTIVEDPDMSEIVKLSGLNGEKKSFEIDENLKIKSAKISDKNNLDEAEKLLIEIRDANNESDRVFEKLTKKTSRRVATRGEIKKRGSKKK